MLKLKRVSSGEMAKKFSMYCDMALNAPLVVTKNGRDRLVLLSVEEYKFLQDWLQEGLQEGEAPGKSEALEKKPLRASTKKRA
jgi:PHD/YefM family antitoxin component YafN of YafNO toxin-antitoxin module